LIAALEGNLGIALLASASRIDNGSRQRLITRRLAVEPQPIEVAAGVRGDNATSAQVLAFIEELKQAALES
jgi:DNA-binding transcriptional LysR family regulator